MAKRILAKLSTIISPEKVKSCACGSYAFFAWGVKMVTTEDYGSAPRNRNYTATDELVICSNCHLPISIVGGEMYDASEYVTKEDVRRIIEYSQAREQRVPVRAMDP